MSSIGGGKTVATQTRMAANGVGRGLAIICSYVRSLMEIPLRTISEFPQLSARVSHFCIEIREPSHVDAESVLYERNAPACSGSWRSRDDGRNGKPDEVWPQ